jgi:small-conductance mechanosensitive channel
LVAGGLTGIVVGLAAQTVLSNLFSGLFMYFDRPLRVGDSIELPEYNVSGVVTDIHVISTRIRTWDGLYVRIPNDKIFTATIKNLMANAARRIEFDIGISYSSDIEKARKIMLEAAHNHPFALAEPPPDVFVKEYGDSAVILSYRVWAPTSVWWGVRTQLLEVIKKRFDEEGIEIPFPQVVNWFRGPLRIVKGEETIA